MAELLRDGDSIILKLSAIEKVEGLHSNIRVPLSSVKSIEILEDTIHAVHGIKFPGTAVPGVLAVGTFISGEGTVFAIVHHNTKRGLKLTLTGESFDAFIVGFEEPEQVADLLGI